MKESTFQGIRSLVYERSGISLGANKQALVRARIAKRMRMLNLDTYEAYLDYVSNDVDGAEVEYMLDVISTNTTNFYREAAHFDMLRNIVRNWVSQKVRKLRVWSAASSSGEEPYTLAIELAESIGSARVDVKILATDLAPSVLKAAILGEYSEDKLEPVPHNLLSKYFIKVKEKKGSVYRVKQELKDMILFRQFNLSVVPYPMKNPLDIIFCRNVMIYFDREVRKRLVNEFRRLLKPGGYLFVGHAESITGLSDGFKCLKPSVYLKE